MELFDKKFVHFMWDDELQGKKCFVSDGIDMLKEYVEHDESNMRLEVAKGHGNRPFAVDWTDDSLSDEYQFAYYDPNYDAKRAFNEGKKVQYQLVGGVDWADINSEEALECRIAEGRAFRVKPGEVKPGEKWIVFLARYQDGLTLCYCDESYWETAKKSDGAKTKLFVGSKDEAKEWCYSRERFTKVIKAWEDGKTIQVYETLFNKWSDCAGTLEWHTDCEYRVKPEEKTVTAKMCSGCVHEHCSATKEPCVSCKPGKSKYEARLCKTCEHFDTEVDEEPCDSCIDDSNAPHWEPKKKEEKMWRPYESSAEMIVDFIDRFKVKCPPYAMPLIWVKGKGNDNRFLVTGFSPEVGVCLDKAACSSFNTLFDYYTYLDGSPVGMEVKE